jgi:multidrug efflux pump subunit AcrA (membrane-fusion protein)
MKFNYIGTKQGLALATGILLAAFSYLIFTAVNNPSLTQESKTSIELYVPQDVSNINGDTFLYPVVGVVSAKQELVVKAKMAGVIESVFVTEGDIVPSGNILAIQTDPVLQAELERQGIQNVLALLREESALSNVKQNLASEEVGLGQSIGVTELSIEANSNRTTAAEAQLKNELEATSATVVDIFSFVVNNSSLFTADSMKLYRQSVDSFYGRTPNYLTTGVLYPRTSEGSIFKRIENLKDVNNIENETEVTQRVIAELNQVLQIFSESERDFLERDILSRDDARYISYTNYRSKIAGLKSDLESSLDNLSSLRDFAGTNSLILTSAAKQAEFSFASAVSQARIGDEIYNNTKVLTAADRQVLLAQASLGISRAPFEGVVSEVLVEEGEYVMPGTSLFKYVGTCEQEIKVRIPESLLGSVKVGNNFMVKGEVVGLVSRVVGIAEAGAVTVFVDLVKPIINGATLSGEINLSQSGEEDPLISIERSHLLFSTAGPYVMTESGERIMVAVVNDGGNILVVRPSKKINEKLKVATGIRL